MRIRVGDVRLFADVIGPGMKAEGGRLVERPTLILLHGGPGYDHTNLRRFHSPLARHAQLVFYDQRGHGRSDAGDRSGWTLARWADDVKALSDALGIDRPIVMGASFGGMVAQTYAARHPDHPRALILHSTAARFNHDLTVAKMAERGGESARQAAIALWQDPGDPDRLERYARICMRHYTVRTPPADPDRVEVTVNYEVLRHFYAPGGEGRDMDLTAANARIRCDTLVLAGVEDPITPVEEADVLARSLTGARVEYVRVEGAAHGVHHDRPDLVRRLFTRFIREHS